MDAGRTEGASDFSLRQLESAPSGMGWKLPAAAAVLILLWLMAGPDSYPLLVPHESRHAGIVHEMWAARQYLVPRIDGLPVLDGAPLYYWLALGFVSLLGADEWVLRLPSAVSAVVLLVVLAKVLQPWPSSRFLSVLFALFLVQPALILTGRYAAPEMLSILFLAWAAGSFFQASVMAEAGEKPARWILSAWIGSGLLGLSAGTLAAFVPSIISLVWLALRRRLDLIGALCWWPAMVLGAAVVLPWLILASARHPGIVPVMLERQVLGLFGHGRHGWEECALHLRALVMFLGSLPLLMCLYRYTDPVRRAALSTPQAGFMAVWLAVVVLLHPLVTMTLLGPAIAAVVPLLYFGALALAPSGESHERGSLWGWILHLVTVAVVWWAGEHLVSARVSPVEPVVSTIGHYYRSATDKVVMLNRYDYEFNYYLRSPKLIYVATDWESADQPGQPAWKEEILASARFARNTAESMLLEYDDFLTRICGRRVVNLWVIGRPNAAERHPVLNDMTEVTSTDSVYAWYLEAGEPLVSEACSSVH